MNAATAEAIPERFFCSSAEFRSFSLKDKPLYMCSGFDADRNSEPKALDVYYEEFAFVYFFAGSGRYQDWTGRTYPLTPGTVYLRLPGKYHKVTFDEEPRYADCFVCFEKSLFDSFVNLGFIESNRPVFFCGLDVSIVLEFESFIKSLKNPTLRAQEILARAFSLCSRLGRNRERPSSAPVHGDLVQHACALLETDLDKRLRIEDVAKQLRLNYHVFRRIFRNEMRISPGDFRIRRRIEMACSLLMTSGVSQVAYQLGYKDPYVFSKQFKKFTGQAPRYFKQKLAR